MLISIFFNNYKKNVKVELLIVSKKKEYSVVIGIYSDNDKIYHSISEHTR